MGNEKFIKGDNKVIKGYISGKSSNHQMIQQFKEDRDSHGYFVVHDNSGFESPDAYLDKEEQLTQAIEIFDKAFEPTGQKSKVYLIPAGLY